VSKKLEINFKDYYFWVAAVGFVLLTGILAGSYPAIYLSSFRPIKVLKGTFKAGNAQVTPRKILVVVQFTFAIVLIISTIIVQMQLQKGIDRKSGYSKDNLIFHFMEGDSEKNYPLIKNELLNSGIAVSVTKTSAPITQGWSNSWGFEWPGKPKGDKTVVNRFVADDAIIKTAGFELIAGRDFDLNKFPTDSSAVILNESAVKLMGFKQPIGQIVKDNGRDWHVVGVIKDFILISPFRPIEPMVIEGAKAWFNVIHIKFSKEKPMAENIKQAEMIFKKYNPEYPFNYSFVDEEYATKFSDEKRRGKLASIFACLAIIISCLGLFGLASYTAENRIKEIGVRKVLGASVTNITRLLSVDFLKLVIIAFLIAGPLAYWLGETWLKDFPYRVRIEWWVFALAGILSIAIALLTVGYQAVKAAMANPVKSLRSE
jgi:ABC-type antimicrobial peptide transport system permease subunit